MKLYFRKPAAPKQEEKESLLDTLPLCEESHSSPLLEEMALPTAHELVALADFYKLFGDPTRLRILTALDGGELCVCDLAKLTDMTKSAISHQLATLRQGHLVKFRRSGKNVYYSLADHHVTGIIEYALAHLREPNESKETV